MKTRKIDLFFEGDYLCSTNQSRTCKEAVKKFLDRIENRKEHLGNLETYIRKHPKGLKAFFDKEKRA